MPGTTRLIGILAAILASQLLAASAQAQVGATWVSGVGNDTNDCQDTFEACNTLGAALAKTSPGGQIRCVDGGFSINLVIDKPITIDCSDGPLQLIGVAGQPAITINIPESVYPDAVVTLRGLTINGLPGLTDAPDGIRVTGGGAALHLDGLVILGFPQQAIEFRPSSSVDLFIRNTTVSDNDGGGIFIAPGLNATVKASLSNVQIDGNGSVGLSVTKASGPVAIIEVDGAHAVKNAVGVRVSGASASIILSESVITQNGTGLQLLNGGKVISAQNNLIHSNTVNGAPTSTLTLQ